MTKLEQKYNAIRVAQASDLDSLGELINEFFFDTYGPIPTYETIGENMWSVTKANGKFLKSYFAVKSGPRYYFMQRCG